MARMCVARALVCLAVLGALASREATAESNERVGAPARPQPPPDFTAVGFQIIESGGFFRNISSIFEYSEAQQKMKTLFNEPYSGKQLLSEVFYNESVQVQSTNGQCRLFGGKFYSFWSGLDSAAYVGTSEPFPGYPCNRWRLNISLPLAGFEEELTWDFLQSDNTRPVQYNATFSTRLWKDIETVVALPPTAMFKPNAVPKLESPHGCSLTPFYCEEGPVKDVPMIRFHPSTDYGIGNTNLGDTVGDSSFMCSAIYNNAQPDYDVVTQYMVSVNTTWGQYALCNKGSCNGGSGVAVGRERSYGVTKFGGQCDPDANMNDTGVWYSLTREGECREGHAVGDGSGCTWRNKQQLKTILVSCLKHVGFLEACERDAFRFPYAQAAASLAQAFALNEPAAGGCPNVDTKQRMARLHGTVPIVSAVSGRGAKEGRADVDPIRAALTFSHLFAPGMHHAVTDTNEW